MMLRHFVAGALLFLPIAAFSADVTEPLASSRLLRDELTKKGGEQLFPDEFASFKEALSKAEKGVASKDPDSGQLVEMALLKGRIIEAKLAVPKAKAQEKPASQPLPPVTAPAPTPAPVLLPPKTATIPETSEILTPSEQNILLPSKPVTPLPDEPVCQTVYPGPNAILGGQQTYVVQKKETIKLVGAKLGINWRKLAKENGFDQKKPVTLKPGQVLYYNNRKIVPKQIENGLVINIPDKMLYLFKEGRLLNSAPIAVGIPRVSKVKPMPDGTPAPEKEHLKWQTPTGSFTILSKTKDPTWTVPPSIQEEMKLEGKKVLVKVPPGKGNPLGRYAMKTSLAGIMLHSTNMPASIYGFSSHGCIRIYPEHMEQLYREINVKTRGEIIYRPVKMAVTDDGRVFLEVHRDVYNKVKDLRKEVQRLVKQNNIADQVDWKKIDRLLKGKSGIAEEVTLTDSDIASAI